jgi:rod shape-determining protein MreB and related proteins
MFILKSKFRKSFVIDLGTNNTLVYESDKGIILEEATAISFDSKRKIFFEFGNSSKKMIGKNPQNVEIFSPLERGAIANLNLAQAYIKKLIQALPKRPFVKPNIFVSVPSDLNYMEKSSVVEAGKNSGAKNVFLIKDPFSAAVGFLKDISKPTGILMLDIGAGVSEISLLSCNGIVLAESLRLAGNDMDKAILEYFKNEKRVLLSLNDAELLKKELGNALEKEENFLSVSVKNLLTRMPQTFKCSSKDVNKAILPIIDKVVELIRKMILSLPTEFLSDIVDRGIYLTGGVSMLKNIDAYFYSKLNLKVNVVDMPLQNNILGAGTISESKNYSSLIFSL